MKLPEHKAPDRLASAVLSRIEKQRRRWWRRPWPSWPLAPKVLSLAGMFTVFGGCVYGLATVPDALAIDYSLGGAGEFFNPLVNTLEPLSTLVKGVALLLRPLAQPWVLAAFAAISFAMYVTCLAVGTAWIRLACAPAPSR